MHRDPDDPAVAGPREHDLVVPAVSEREVFLPDVPLIVEDLLNRAKRLADSCAPTAAIEAILDHVAALREGRG